ncbi:MAG: hypothetical protein IJ877_06460 [Candidatus Gastranaerophilales bacterium]|nr:hypothetical protein [Candidatus Gastranaerophilales bacterium]
MRITNNNNTNFKGANLSKLASPLSVFYDKNSIIPTLIIETGVTLGRTYEANKKGGKKEAVERFVEQGVSAGVWLFGVQAIRKVTELYADLFKIPKTENFKALNMFSSLAIATGFIGFVLPKINHFISKKIMDSSSKKNEKTKQKESKSDSLIRNKSFDEFSKKNKTPSFTSLYTCAQAFEQNSVLRLLVTDTGVIAGRFKNGRNKYERIEGLFRDIASIYFYLRATNDFVNLAGKIGKIETIDKERLKELLKKPDLATNSDNKAIRASFALYSIGTLLSAFALGILIPKVQYFIRNKLTNKDQFPGDEGYKVDLKQEDKHN